MMKEEIELGTANGSALGIPFNKPLKPKPRPKPNKL